VSLGPDPTRDAAITQRGGLLELVMATGLDWGQIVGSAEMTEHPHPPADQDHEKVKKHFASEDHRGYHVSQLREPKRSTLHLARFVKKVLGSQRFQTMQALDAGCGGGANMLHLSSTLPNAKWVGVDSAQAYVKLARESVQDPRFEFLLGDFYSLHEDFSPDQFDVCFSIQTLSWLPDYEDAIRELMQVTRGWIFVTSLFSDSFVDAFIRVVDRADQFPGLDANYNVYSYPRFESFCKNLGARDVTSTDFEIDVDLNPPEDGGMGTYTIRTENRGRMQVSGPLLMPWKFVAIRVD